MCEIFDERVMNDQISYTIRKSKRAKHVRLSVHGDGRVVVTLPQKMQENIARAFVKEKKGWLLDKLSLYKKFVDTNISPILSNKLGKKDYLKNKEEARTLVAERVVYLNKIYGHSYNKIFIRNQKTRWGSCSNKGNLNFNYKILFLPPALRDYVIVHELCHLKEFNHSQKFWRLVAVSVPNYSVVRRELKRHALSLM